MIKKILKITGILLLVLIVAAFALPFLFKGKIISLIKDQANKHLEAKLDFSDLDISLFRHFPRLALGLDSFRLTGVKEFDGDTLFSAQRIDVAVNLFSMFGSGTKEIHAVAVESPRIHALVHKDGKANWSITKPSPAKEAGSEASSLFNLQLQNYAFHHGYISYRDEEAHMSSEIINLEHSGSGDFTSDLFTLKTSTHADAVSFTYGGIPWLNAVQTKIDADIQVNNKTNTYTFKTDKIALNNLGLNTDGSFQLVNDSTYAMNINFNAPSNAFKNILSLVPGLYQKDFAGIKTSGEASFNGFVKGTYDKTHIPAYAVNLGIQNGSFQYPELPRPVKNIQLEMKVDNPDGITDHTTISIPHAHLEMDDAPFDFHLLLKKPITDQQIDAAAKGRLDLSQVAKYIKLSEGTKLSGLLQADFSLAGSIAALEKKNYEGFDAKGNATLENFYYASKDYPDGISLTKVVTALSPKNVTVSALEGTWLHTTFNATGSVNNVLAYVLNNKPLDGIFNVHAGKLNLNEWMGVVTDTTKKTTDAANSQPFAVPANLNLLLNASADEVLYDNLNLQQLTGSLQIADEAVKLNNVKANALDGMLIVNGAYSTKENKKKPDILLNYEVQNVDVQKTFFAFNTVQKLMPVGKYLSGRLSSKLNMNGKLGQNMYPDLSTLTGEGNLLLIEGFLKKFEPLGKLASAVNLDQLKDVALKDVKTYFSFRNGKVIVNPFHLKIDQVDMEIGGTHGFDQTLDYAITMKVPRALFGAQANGLINNLTAQAAGKGVNLKLSDLINLNIKMGGTITNPSVKTDLKDALAGTANSLKQQATDFVQAKVDSAKQQLKDTANALRKQVVADAADELKKQLSGKKDSSLQNGGLDNTKKKAEETGKSLLNNLFKKKNKDTLKH